MQIPSTENHTIILNETSIYQGYSFESSVAVSKEDISKFATLLQDENPLHHDEAYAAASRFGGIIASGPHIMSLFTSMVASHFSKLCPMVGTHFEFDFLLPIMSEDNLTMRWTILTLDPFSKPNKIPVRLNGLVESSRGITIKAVGDILLFPSNSPARI
ncbi:Acyl dehydratase [Thiothrix eikelboomii]|uniref:Acyl dehydratase n=1 Tax=Thiothrix eikelboomii TaxID=92487 RepID=A0A1T4XLI8_9GAMM|nr:MaoC family dehydratase [Thiothrix eikelboomii]SKA90366.1 Acyl dehydratase [Thiothrix eikelboomii]